MNDILVGHIKLVFNGYMKLTANQYAISGINSKTPHGFAVPDFQRNYSWTESEIRQFWTDIENVFNDISTDHFLGPIVVLETDNARVPLIDGQQRITTLMILASVIRDYLINEMNNPYLETEGTSVFISQKVSQILFLSDLRTARLESNYQIKDVFDKYIVRNPNTDLRRHFSTTPSLLQIQEKRASKSLEASQKYLKQLFESWVEKEPSVEARKLRIDQLIDVMLSKLQFLYIEVGNEEDAFTIFETLNDRGLKLSPGDLIKSYLLRRIVEQNSLVNRQSIIDTWERIPTHLEDYDISNFLRHYLLTEFNEPIQKKKIFSVLRNRLEIEARNDSTAAKKQLDAITTASFHYGRLLGSESISEDSPEIQRRLELLSMIGDSYRVFLLKVMSLGFSEDDLMLAIKSVEKIAFRWIACKWNAQELETKLQKAAHQLVSGDSAQLLQVCKSLIDDSPGDDIFENSFKLGISKETKLQAYVMRSLCFGITGSDVTTNRREVSVEHIAPQNPRSDYWFSVIAPNSSSEENVKIYQDFVYRWGNITILENKLNSSIRDAEWNIKKNGNGRKGGYNLSSIQTTKDLMNFSNWSAELIEKRSEWVAEQALIYWKKEIPRDVQLTPFSVND